MSQVLRIVIDGYEANVPQRLGSSQVAYELLRNIEKIDAKNEYTILVPNPPLDDLPKERKRWKYRILRPKRLWTRIAVPLYLYQDKPDIIFSPTHYIPRFSPCKRVATIFDLSFLHFPESFLKKDLYKLKNWTKYSIESADHILTISEFSKKDIFENYGISKDNITVAYPGYNRDIFQPQNAKIKVKVVKSKYKIEDPYIMYIGTIQPRKNLIRLMDAVKTIAELKLVIAGKAKGEGRSGWKYQEILDAPNKLGIGGRVKFLGYVPVDDLSCLLAGALGYIQPSLWEGFGIPAVEAMATGTPVLVANSSSLGEVVGDAGLTFDPCSVDQIKESILNIYSDDSLRKNLIEKGLKRAQKFSWKAMAEKVLSTLEKVTYD